MSDPARHWPLLRCGRCGSSLVLCQVCHSHGKPSLYCPRQNIECAGPRELRGCSCPVEERRLRRYGGAVRHLRIVGGE